MNWMQTTGTTAGIVIMGVLIGASLCCALSIIVRIGDAIIGW